MNSLPLNDKTMMDTRLFVTSLTQNRPPVGLTVQLEALWHDGKGDWERAHDLINDLEDKQSAHVHAYLHRKEGDLWNADYWYRRAGKQRPSLSLEEEWEDLVRSFLL
ncbi:hypothetical protein ACFQRK_06145 [Parapedobacter sp. GCM10030251]|uniref:hypothetical protein n=1 Tax=Parapedobacter sp. GCM10030251 TaxID=3273419 RepID=UPI00360A9B5E